MIKIKGQAIKFIHVPHIDCKRNIFQTEDHFGKITNLIQSCHTKVYINAFRIEELIKIELIEMT